MARRAADLFAASIAADPRTVCLLPAGNTPRPLYEELRTRAKAGELDLEAYVGVQLDEMVGAGPDDDRSFHAFLRRELISNGHELLLDGGADDPDEEIEAHAARLAAAGGPGLAVLGLGLNGHLAFNEPGSSRDSEARRVRLDERTIGALPGSGIREGITLGLREILDARRVLILVTGSSKREVLARLLATPPTTELPASFLHEHPDATVLADAAALPD